MLPILLSLKTGMHSSRMRTAGSSSHLLERGVCLPQCMLGYTPLPPGLGMETPWAWRPPRVILETPPARPPNNFPPGCGSGDCRPADRILDTCFWKYYLAPTSLRVVIMQSLQNGLATHFWVTPLFSMRTELLVSSVIVEMSQCWCRCLV